MAKVENTVARPAVVFTTT